jgi:hypothetical protein
MSHIVYREGYKAGYEDGVADSHKRIAELKQELSNQAACYRSEHKAKLEAWDEIQRFREAAKKYMYECEHDELCASRAGQGYCSCGFDALQAALQGEGE